MKNLTLAIYIIFFMSIYQISCSLLNKQGELKTEVLDIFKIFTPYIKKNSNADIDKILQNPTISELNNISQSLFLRPKNYERNSNESIEHYNKITSMLSEDNKKNILKIMKKLGVFTDEFPKQNKYDHIIIHGAEISTMRDRIMFLSKLVENNKIDITNSKLYFLCGERPLFKSETKEVILNPEPYKSSDDFIAPIFLPTYERDAAKIAWNQLKLDDTLRNHPIKFIEANKKPGTKRATTEDCVDKWIKQNPDAGSCLIISNNPFIFYQTIVTKLGVLKSHHIKKQEFIFDGAGMGIKNINSQSKETLIGTLMDSIARILYVENKI